jgi:hypothetical protein
MTYPERGATYKHKPKFIERMKRAEGGGVTDSINTKDLEASRMYSKYPSGTTSSAGAGRLYGPINDSQYMGGYKVGTEMETPLPDDEVNVLDKLKKHGGRVRKGD